MPVLLKLETDQLIEKANFNIFSNKFSPFEFFILILLIIFIVTIIERIISSITDIFLRSKEELLLNETQLELFKKMENMEV
jgi:hypothetical protein